MAKLPQQQQQPCCTALTFLLVVVLVLSAVIVQLVVYPSSHAQMGLSGTAFPFSSCSRSREQQQLPRMRDAKASFSYKNRNNISSWEGLSPPPGVTLQELFSSDMTPTALPSEFSSLSPVQNPNFTSQFLLPFPAQHKQYSIRNACIEPGGRLLLVNVTPDELGQKMPGGVRKRPFNWYVKYANCGNLTGDECVGVRYISTLPTYAKYVPGNTMHFIAYFRGNTFHNFAERVWPRLALSVSPFNETTEGLPVHHFFFHKLDELLEQASQSDDKDQVLWQFRMLMELWPGSDLLRVGDENATLCFDVLHLQMHFEDRMDHTHLSPTIFGPAVHKYRTATFRFLNMPAPEIPLPPAPLRVLYYGRSELSRRRAMNHDEILHFLQNNMSRVNLEIRSLDLLLLSKQMDYSFARLVSIFSQTDILVIAHGALTFGTMFMPLGAGVVEIAGPCDWSKPKELYNDTANFRTWVAPLTQALSIKHDLSNPYRESIPNPQRGNTTLCIHPGKGVPDFTIDPQKLGQVIDSFAYPQTPGDRLTLHWLYDWEHT